MDMNVDTPDKPSRCIPKKRVYAFLEKLAKETSVSKGKALLEHARKINERTRLIQKRRQQKHRMRRMANDLETTEAQIQLVEENIAKLESVVEDGTDGEYD